MHNTVRSHAGLGILVALLIGALVWWQPLLLQRLIQRPDALTHMRWSHEFYVGLQDGMLYPRWAYASHQGLGDATFMYYQPMLYYISAIFAALSIKANYALVLAAGTPYVLLAAIAYTDQAARHGVARGTGAALLVAACPAVYFIATNGGAFPWSLALPWCLLFVVESIRDRPRVAHVAVLLALICLSHLLSALAVLLCIGVARLLFAPPARHAWFAHRRWTTGVALGLALAGFFVVPAVGGQGLINAAAWTAEPSLDWRRAFAFPLFTWRQYGIKWLTFQWLLPVSALLLALAAAWLVRHVAEPVERVRASGRLLLVAALALALSSELAYPLYAAIPPLQKLQWPYRFVPLAMVLATLAYARVAFLPAHTASRRMDQLVKSVSAAALLLQLGLMLALQYQNFSSGEPIPAVAIVMRGDFGQPEYLPPQQTGTWADYNRDGQFAGECTRLRARCQSLVRNSHAMTWSVWTPVAITPRLPLFAYPGWKLRVDGADVALVRDASSGLATVMVAAGSHTIEARWRGIALQSIGNWVSVIALLVLGGYLLLAWRRRDAAI